jgi:hypothetical protein
MVAPRAVLISFFATTWVAAALSACLRSSWLCAIATAVAARVAIKVYRGATALTGDSACTAAADELAREVEQAQRVVASASAAAAAAEHEAM